MDDPKTVQWAESSAAPTFGELMQFLLQYGNVEPTETYTQRDVDAFNATHTLKDLFMKDDSDNGNKPADNPTVNQQQTNTGNSGGKEKKKSN
jgi:glycine cleavage system protein P-like pyridoxal-binding family